MSENVRRIVVVDDEETSIDTHEIFLRNLLLKSTSLGGKAITSEFFTDPHKALTKMQAKQHVDVLVLDLDMPGMDGYQLLSALIENQVSIGLLMVVTTHLHRSLSAQILEIITDVIDTATGPKPEKVEIQGKPVNLPTFYRSVLAHLSS